MAVSYPYTQAVNGFGGYSPPLPQSYGMPPVPYANPLLPTIVQNQSEWLLMQVPGLLTPLYVHTPTWFVYESPILQGAPLGIYQLNTGMLNVYPSFFSSVAAQEYRALPVETPYSAAALAYQGGKYPPTSLSVPNEYAYPSSYFGVAGFPYPSYSGYGQPLIPGQI